MRGRPPVSIIGPQGPSFVNYVREAAAARELMLRLTLKEIQVRYKQTAIGVVWVLLQPLATMAVFAIFFGKLAGLPTDGIPPPLFYLSGLVLWIYFANAVLQGTNSIVNHQNMVKKIYFPKLCLPIAAVTVGILDLSLSSLLLVGMLCWYGVVPIPAAAYLLPACIALTYFTALAVCLWLAPINALFRDVKHAVPFAVQLILFLSPVAYGTSVVPERWQRFYALNPMTTAIEGFRYGLTGRGGVDLQAALVSTSVTLVALLTGLLYFRHIDGTLADRV